MPLSDAAWPAVLVTGAVVVSAGAGLAALGCVADAVRNERLYVALFLRSGVPLTLLGTSLVILGALGWWVVLAVVGLSVFGWLIRPRKPADSL